MRSSAYGPVQVIAGSGAEKTLALILPHSASSYREKALLKIMLTAFADKADSSSRSYVQI